MPIFLADEDGSYLPAETTSSARLVVLSDGLPPDEIGAALGLTADRWWLGGEFDSHPRDERWRRSRPHPFNGWEIGSRLQKGAAPDEHLIDFSTGSDRRVVKSRT